MEHPGDSPASHATRRRVWRFVFGSLFVVAVVAFWPIKGYWIDDERFVVSLRPALPVQRIGYLGPEVGAANFWFGAWNTPVRAESMFRSETLPITGLLICKALPGFDGKVVAVCDAPELDPFGNLGPVREAHIYWFLKANIVGTVYLSEEALPPGKTYEQTARDCVAAILDGIEREIPGVTTFYNPIARQLYHDRVQPFYFEKVRPSLKKLIP